MTIAPDDPERDPALAKAWREHSAEMPPAHLDAAILAAARRAVGSAPEDATEDATEDAAARPRVATSPQRWWMPLAAAAAIGAVAIGILQVVPQDHAVSDMRAPSVSDMPAPASSVASSGAPSVSSPPTRDTLAPSERKDAPRAQTESVAPQSPTNVVPPPAAPPPAISRANVAPAQSAPKVLAQREADGVAAPGAAMEPAPQPFPADKKRASAESGFAQDRAGATGSITAAPSALPRSEPQRALADAAPAPSPDVAATHAPARMAAARDERQRNETAQSAPEAAGAPALAKTYAESTSGKPVDVDAWIVRIRRLHDDGKLGDAAKELVALRATIPDADRRLPPELHAWAATVKP
jgi:hypothetical protein